MTLVQDGQKFIPANKPGKPTKAGIRVISEMSTPRILWFVTCKHSKGLKTLAIVGLAGYIAYDKVLKHIV